jgi:hypothetical protein
LAHLVKKLDQSETKSAGSAENSIYSTGTACSSSTKIPYNGMKEIFFAKEYLYIFDSFNIVNQKICSVTLKISHIYGKSRKLKIFFVFS